MKNTHGKKGKSSKAYKAAGNGFVLSKDHKQRPAYASETESASSDTERLRRTDMRSMSSVGRLNPNPASNPLHCSAQNFNSIRASETHHNCPSLKAGSEDSFGLKRKSMSVDLRDCFEISLEGLSKEGRSELRKRIKLEMRKVRALTQKLEARQCEVKQSFQMHSGASQILRYGAPSRSLHSGYYAAEASESSFKDKTTKKQAVSMSDANVETFIGKDKKAPKADQRHAGLVKDKLLHPERHRPCMDASLLHSRISGIMKQCSILLSKMMSHKFGWIFNEPVDAIKLGLHDYHQIIQKPMDLGTIKKKINSGVYDLPREFCDDVRLTFANAMKYNPQGHEVYNMAKTLRGMFESKWKTMEEKVREVESASQQLECDMRHSDPLAMDGINPGSAPRPSSSSSSSLKRPNPPPLSKPPLKPTSMTAPLPKREMTFDEKEKLSEQLGMLDADKLEEAVRIMRKNPNIMQTDDEIEVDIESFDVETLWELHQFVTECMKTNRDADIPVMQQPSDVPKVSNGASRSPASSVQKDANGVVEEEVDIGDDVPAKEFPPVVIEKDKVVHANVSSSSSSSSGSGSSSSESDSGSSSGSDSEADDAHSPRTISRIADNV